MTMLRFFTRNKYYETYSERGHHRDPVIFLTDQPGVTMCRGGFYKPVAPGLKGISRIMLFNKIKWSVFII